MHAKPQIPGIVVNDQQIPPPVVWSIAGSDSGAGAGIQADLRAFQVFGVHGCTAIAALTAQNSVGVNCIEAVSPDMLDAQLAALAADMPPVAIKTGMLASAENIAITVKWVDKLRTQYPKQHIALVVDPVFRASTGAPLADARMRDVILRDLLPRATLVKPNLREALWLVSGEEEAGYKELAHTDIPELAKALRCLGAGAVVVTGGDQCVGNTSMAADWLDCQQACGWLTLPHVKQPFTHGTGCTFTASVAAALALGFCEADAVVLAKMATTSAIYHGYMAGAGVGPAIVQPDFALQPEYLPSLQPYFVSQTQAFPPLSNEWMGLYPVMPNAQWVKKVIQAGAKTVQLRVKEHIVKDELSQQIRACVQVAKAADVQFFVNDYWELAIEHGAYGVHLGQEDLDQADLQAIRQAGLRLGVSTQSLWELCRARAILPSCIACGPIFATQTKEMQWLPQGDDNLAYWCKVAGLPVVAIGGIDVQRSESIVRSGAQGLAVVSAITHARDPQQAIAELQMVIQAARGKPLLTPPRLPHSTLSR